MFSMRSPYKKLGGHSVGNSVSPSSSYTWSAAPLAGAFAPFAGALEASLDPVMNYSKFTG